MAAYLFGITQKRRAERSERHLGEGIWHAHAPRFNARAFGQTFTNE